jgi:hypothetical protein
VITRKDVNEIQLAKAAIRSGVEVLLAEAGTGYDDIDAFVVAGAFATHLDIESSIRLGTFPLLPLDRFPRWAPPPVRAPVSFSCRLPVGERPRRSRPGCSTSSWPCIWSFPPGI